MKDKRYKEMVSKICKTLKDEKICCFLEIEGGKIDEMRFEPCDKVLIIGITQVEE